VKSDYLATHNPCKEPLTTNTSAGNHSAATILIQSPLEKIEEATIDHRTRNSKRGFTWVMTGWLMYSRGISKTTIAAAGYRYAKHFVQLYLLPQAASLDDGTAHTAMILQLMMELHILL
jgi:hypothetical protein